MTEYPGNSNGKIIKWSICGISLFEWDEDFKYRFTYHITPTGQHKDIGTIHYWQLAPIPEPYATIFFK